MEPKIKYSIKYLDERHLILDVSFIEMDGLVERLFACGDWWIMIAPNMGKFGSDLNPELQMATLAVSDSHIISRFKDIEEMNECVALFEENIKIWEAKAYGPVKG